MKFIGRLIVYILFIYSPVHAEQDTQVKLTKVQLYNLGVKLGKIQQVQDTPLLYAPAMVVIPPDQEYIISAAQAGLVKKLYAAVGDPVTQGQRLVDINSPDLLVLQRQFIKAANNRNLAQAGYERDKKLHKEGVISDRRWQETKSYYESIIADLNEARQMLEITGISKKAINKLAKTRKLTSNLSLGAPIEGVILERLVVAGERIDMLAPIYRMANLEKLWLEINIPQEKMKNVHLDDQVLINDSSASAHITLLGQHVNPKNQTVLARAEIDQADANIRAGQSVNTQIIQTSQVPVYKVANAAIAQLQEQNFIFVRTESGFNALPVTVLGKEADYSIISGNLTADTIIAVRGAVALKAKWVGLGDEESH